MKRIIVCCDGTWNKPGSKDRGQAVETNVEKIYKAVDTRDSSMQQIKFYGPGVGTSFALTDQILGGSIGIGIDKNIQDAYKFLMWSYEPGDEVYLFGFSRGAYTIRSLGGLIRNCGIMKPAYMHLIRDAYHLYRDRTVLTHPDCDAMVAFRKSYSIEPETSIKFMGVWDTVGALGIPISWFNWWNRKYQFHDVKLSSHIRYAYHALAVDEKRRVFNPALWEISRSALEKPIPQVCEQVWFPGVHGNIGGGYVDCGLSNVTLKWMIDKARATGLEFDENKVNEVICNPRGELRPSANFFYRLTGLRMRKINQVLCRASQEEVLRNERVHYSCFERFHFDQKYRPKNLMAVLNDRLQFDPQRDKWEPEWHKYLESCQSPAEHSDSLISPQKIKTANWQD